MSVETIEKLLKPGVPDQLSALQSQNLVLQLIILCIDPIEPDALKFISRFLTPQDFDDLVEERTVLSKCGYPTCPHMLRDSRGNVRNPQTHTVLPWQHEFCQLQCYQSAQFYREQLSREPLATRKNVAYYRFGDLPYEQDILLLPEVMAIAHMNHRTVTETVADIIKSQHLIAKLNELEIDKPAENEGSHGNTKHSDSSILSLGIREKHIH